MKQVSFLILVCLLLACTARAPSLATPENSGLPAVSAPALSSPDVFEVQAWVDHPTPSRDQRVTVSASLIKNGVRLGGMMMQGFWPDQTQERGMPNCNVQVIYGSGVCSIPAEGFPSGEFVPVTVQFTYEGKIYRGQTGFTPR